MTKKLTYISLFMLISISFASAEKIIPVKKVIPMEMPKHPIVVDDIGIRIYKIKAYKDVIQAFLIDVVSNMLDRGTMQHSQLLPLYHAIINYSYTGSIDLFLNAGGYYHASSLIHDASSVWIDGKQIQLIDSYVPAVHLQGYIDEYSSSYERSIYSAYAFQKANPPGFGARIVAILRKKNDWVESEMLGVWQWNSLIVNNKCELQDIYPLHKKFKYATRADPHFFEGWFSNSGRFFCIRQLLEFRAYEDYDNSEFLFPSVVYPGAFLYEFHYVYKTNTKWGYGYSEMSMPRFREVNRDVDFTKDEAYFITERDDMPTLVDVETDENILRYDMPVVMMAACFSPDDRTLYIAGEDNQLYVFDSGLQASAAENWPLYH